MKAYVHDVFDCWGQSVINELANKELRMHDTQDQPNKILKRVKRWAIPRQHELIKQFGRKEVEITTAVPVPPEIPPSLTRVTEEQKT